MIIACSTSVHEGDLDCVAYTNLPDGCDELSGKYVRLEEALHGLRQSGLRWNDGPVVNVKCASDGAVQD